MWSMNHGTLHPLGIHPSQPFRFFSSVKVSVSNRPISLVQAALRSEPCDPTTTRMAGVVAKRSASLVSS